MKHLKNFSICFAKLFIRLVLCILLGTILMITVYTIPTTPMDNHLANSVKTFEEEGITPYYFNLPLPYFDNVRDNFTDAIMLLTAVHPNGDDNVIQSAMLNYRSSIDSESYNPVAVVIDHYANGKDCTVKLSYERYWHGYLVYLKPSLFFFTYANIRCFNHIFQLLLFIVITFLFYKRNMLRYEISYIVSLLTIVPFALMLNLQLSCCYTILQLGVIFILLFSQKLGNKSHYIFLYLGIATAFFDFLTYPIATFGVPAVIYFCMTDKGENIRQKWIKFFKIGFSWVLGYIGMWSGKWIIGSLLTDKNVIREGIENVINRTGMSDSKKYTALQSIKVNISAFFDVPIRFIVCIFTVVFLVAIVWMMVKNKIALKKILEITFPFIWIAILPFMWYAVAKNHSIIHAGLLTDKSLVVTIAAWTTTLMKLLSYCSQSEKLHTISS